MYVQYMRCCVGWWTCQQMDRVKQRNRGSEREETKERKKRWLDCECAREERREETGEIVRSFFCFSLFVSFFFCLDGNNYTKIVKKEITIHFTLQHSLDSPPFTLSLSLTFTVTFSHSLTPSLPAVLCVHQSLRRQPMA